MVKGFSVIGNPCLLWNLAKRAKRRHGFGKTRTLFWAGISLAVGRDEHAAKNAKKKGVLKRQERLKVNSG